MKIIYMGTPDFAVEALEALASSRHEVTAVFTQPDKPKGRGKAMQFTPVKEVALRENIPVYQPKKVRDPEVIQKIRELAPDVLVVVAFGQIIPQHLYCPCRKQDIQPGRRHDHDDPLDPGYLSFFFSPQVLIFPVEPEEQRHCDDGRQHGLKSRISNAEYSGKLQCQKMYQYRKNKIYDFIFQSPSPLKF